MDKFLGKILVARTSDGSKYAVGLCISCTEHPTVTLVSPQGEKIHWRADMCEVVVSDEVIAAELIPLDGKKTAEPPLRSAPTAPSPLAR
jgi:hypothetical protein